MEENFDCLEVEKALDKDGIYASTTRGVSMEPLFHTHRDMVIIKKPTAELKKFDVALYHGRSGQYIMHRVIKVLENEYLIRGDNTFVIEHVPKGAVIGVLDQFIRKGKNVTCDSKKYRLYVRFWNFIYPVRYVYHLFRMLLSKVYHKIFKRKHGN